MFVIVFKNISIFVNTLIHYITTHCDLSLNVAKSNSISSLHIA